MMEIMTIMMLMSKNKFMKLMMQNSIFMLFFNSLFTLKNMNLDINNIYMFMYIDKYCMMLIILTLWISAISLMITEDNKMMMILILTTLVIFTFSSSSMFFFYVWFEISLIPLFIIIFLWGNSKERSLASMYMLIYTMLGSLPLLMSILNIYKNNYSVDWDYLMMFNINNIYFINYWNLIVAFLIKIPVFGFHIWLPKAHVEAPVYGSMILASIILKLGSMGLMRTMMISMKTTLMFNSYFMMTMMSGTLFISMICIMQMDMKMIVAYSSVVHMGIVTISMMTMFNWGFSGSYIMMIGHGLCSSSMFYMVNIMYIRSNTRVIFLNKGLINKTPSLSMMWFLSCIANMGAPISLNFFSELMMMNSIISWSMNMIMIMMLINIMSSIYSMNLFIMTSHGKMNNYLFLPIKMIEFHVIILHLIPLNLLSINSWTWNMNF